jgi:hypothetical protein
MFTAIKPATFKSDMVTVATAETQDAIIDQVVAWLTSDVAPAFCTVIISRDDDSDSRRDIEIKVETSGGTRHVFRMHGGSAVRLA